MITALGLGTKQAPDNVNLDPQRQFWSWLSAFKNPDELGDSGHHERAYFSGFACTQTEPAGMTIQIGGGSSTDSALLVLSEGKCVLLSTDGEPEVVTIPTAPASGSRIDAVVSYIDTTSADPESETPGTPEYVHTIVVSGTAASSPSAPTDSQIVAALPAGANSKYYRWCDVKVAANQTVITNSDITDKKPMSPNVYFTTQDALAQARTVAPRYGSRVTISDDSYSAPSNGVIYFIGNINTTQYGSAVSVAVGGTVVWRVKWNVDQQNYNWDASGSVLVRQGDSVTFSSDKGGSWTSRIFVPIN